MVFIRISITLTMSSLAEVKEHKSLFNYKTLISLFSEKGFVSNLIEYWIDKGKFHRK